MRQLYGSGGDFGLSGSTVYSGLDGREYSTTEAAATAPWSAPGTFSNLKITIDVAPGVGKSRTFTIRVNGVNSGVAVTIADGATTGSHTSSSVTVAAGDRVALEQVATGSPAAVTRFAFNVEFVGSTANESSYQSNATLIADNTVETFNGLFTNNVNWAAAATHVVNVSPLAGTISRWDVRIQTAPGATQSWVFAIYKNGVKQDGGGGTPDTRITIGTGVTVGSASGFSLTVAAGDTFYMSVTPTNTPTVVRVNWSLNFVATVAGQAMLGGFSSNTLDDFSTEYQLIRSGGAIPFWTATEANLPPQPGWITRASFTRLYLLLMDGSPGAGNSYAITLRRSGTSPGGTLTATIADAATTANDLVNSLTVNPVHNTNLQCVPTSFPTVRRLSWAMAVEALSSGGGAGKGNSGGKKGGGGGLTIQQAGGTTVMNIGNPGLDIGST